jgi:hypothetical protein
MRVLSTFERLFEMQARLAAYVERPVYIVGQSMWTGDRRYRLPRGTTYIPMGSLELFLSRWTEGEYQRREEIPRGEGAPPRSIFYFDLVPSPVLRLVFPYLEEPGSSEEVVKATHRAFAEVGLHPYLNVSKTVFLSEPDVLPEELKPFVKERRTHHWKGPSVAFYLSESIVAPNEMRRDWHRGLTVQREHGPPMVTLQAPGQYAGPPLPTVEDVNTACLIDCDPGPCVVCRGASGERRHLATFQCGGPPYPLGHLCRQCSRGAFQSWQKLLDEETPVADPASPEEKKTP